MSVLLKVESPTPEQFRARLSNPVMRLDTDRRNTSLLHLVPPESNILQNPLNAGRPPEVVRASFDGGLPIKQPSAGGLVGKGCRDRHDRISDSSEPSRVGSGATFKASSEGGYPVPDCFGNGQSCDICTVYKGRQLCHQPGESPGTLPKAVTSGGVLE